MRKFALVAMTLVAQPALANDKQDFSTCDGRIHPGKQDDGMRGEAGVSSYGLPNSMLAGLLGQLKSAGFGRIEACTRALASERLLPGQVLRKAHLLRARAAAYLSSDKVELALADIDAAEALMADRGSDRFYRRSMGASLQMLRAIARAQQGDVAGAAELARAAQAERPYSIRLQAIAAQVLAMQGDSSGQGASPWDTILRLDPDQAENALRAESQAGNYAAVLRLAPGANTTIPDQTQVRFKPGMDLMAMLFPREAMAAVSNMSAIAHARAASGDLAGAQQLRDQLAARMAERRANAAAALAAPPPAKDAAQPAQGQAPQPGADAAAVQKAPPPALPPDPLDNYADSYLRQIDLRLALGGNRLDQAVALAKSGKMPNDSVTLNLLEELNRRLPEKDRLAPGTMPQTREATEKARRQDLRSLADLTLLAPETPRSVVDYSKSRPNILGALVGGALSFGTTLLGGIDRTDGFRSTPQPDGTIKVEFVGNTPSEPMVQEMTLLRAAELARAGGKWGFVIAKRADYTRYLVTSQYGVETSRVPTGHKTELFVRPVDEGEDKVRSFSAVEVIDALGPYYYEDKAAKK